MYAYACNNSQPCFIVQIYSFLCVICFKVNIIFHNSMMSFCNEHCSFNNSQWLLKNLSLPHLTERICVNILPIMIYNIVPVKAQIFPST